MTRTGGGERRARATAPGIRPLHDRASLVTYAQLTVYGWFLYSFGPSVPLIRDDEGTSNSTAALHGTLFSLATVAVALAGPRIVARLGRGLSLRLGGIITACGLALYCATSILAVSLAGALVTGLGAGLIIVFSNAHLNAHQGAAAPAALAEANGLASVAGTVAPLAVGAAIGIGWGWRPGVLAAAVGFLVIELFRGSLAGFNDGERAPGEPLERPHLSRTFWISTVALACLVGVEFCLVLWSSELLRVRAGLGPGAAAASLTAVVAGMAIGRGVGSRLARRLDPESLLVGTIALAFVGFVGAWLGGSAVVILAALFVTGAGVGMHWPLGISRAVRASDHHADLAVSHAAAVTGCAAATAPFALGWLADSVGVLDAFLVVPALLLAALALVLARRIPGPAEVTAASAFELG